ncbi:MAG TPA: ribose 5-phosphate isomerase B [bacterium]|nr:ribose 5-phosphate isomerase B [bacterium]
MSKERIAIGADHAGFLLKEEVKSYLIQLGYDVVDHGCKSEDRVDYPDYAKLVAEDVGQGRVDRGLLVCGSGIGMAITANKFAGVRAASIIDEVSAKLSRQHNDLNVLCLGARLLDWEHAKAILEIFLNTEFEGGRHAERVEKIRTHERMNSSPQSGIPLAGRAHEGT